MEQLESQLSEAVKKLKIRYKDRNRIMHQVNMGELLEFYLSSLTRTFDPHSSYLSAQTMEDTINQQLHLSLEGIGASLASENGFATVKEIVRWRQATPLGVPHVALEDDVYEGYLIPKGAILHANH